MPHGGLHVTQRGVQALLIVLMHQLGDVVLCLQVVLTIVIIRVAAPRIEADVRRADSASDSWRGVEVTEFETPQL